MKQICLILTVLLIGCTVNGQTPMPDKMAKSIIVLRLGIADLDNTTVGSIFLGKKFDTTELLDGSVSTARYGKTRLDGNTYYLPIERLNNGKIEVIITYVLEFNGDCTWFKTVLVQNFKTSESVETSVYGEKYQFLKIFDNLQVQTATTTEETNE